MGKVVDFADGWMGCWARIELENGDPVHISVAQSGVRVKRSNSGLFGAKLFEENNAYRVARTAQELDMSVGEYNLPPRMNNAILKAFTQATLECKNAAEVAVRLNNSLKVATLIG